MSLDYLWLGYPVAVEVPVRTPSRQRTPGVSFPVLIQQAILPSNPSGPRRSAEGLSSFCAPYTVLTTSARPCRSRAKERKVGYSEWL